MVSVHFWIQRAIAKVITSMAGLILSNAFIPQPLHHWAWKWMCSLHVSLQTFTLLFFNLCWVGPANQHALHQRTLLSLDFHMSLASGRQWLQIKGRKVKSRFLYSFLPLPDSTGQLLPSTKGHSSCWSILPWQLFPGSSLLLPWGQPCR